MNTFKYKIKINTISKNKNKKKCPDLKSKGVQKQLKFYHLAFKENNVLTETYKEIDNYSK